MAWRSDPMERAVLIGLAEWVVDVLDRLGYLGVVLLIAAENLFPPIPSEVILPLSGVLVGQERMTYPLAVAAATAGSLLGALMLYGLGAWVGEDRMRIWIDRLPLLDAADADRGFHWFARFGSPAVLYGRLVPVVRSVISLPAGVERMPLGRFMTYTVLGSGAWNALLVGAGWGLGEQWEVVRKWLSSYQLAVVLVVMVVVLWFVARRVRRHVRGRGASG
jgi:membrane protein DedA with SNARE-associated domain